MKNIYVCGPTVYSKVHIGNMRPILTFDTVIKAMNYLGTDVNFIHNITDIDDKIIKAALERNVTEQDIANEFTDHYKEILKESNVTTITQMPTVTDHMQEIIDFIGELIEKESAYEMNGNVWFDLSSDSKYGSISNRKIEDMNFTEEHEKRHPGDFALWKKTTEGIVFDSPWGKGRPGWHTECVVFVNKLAGGTTLDIHGGGIDLLFPHHENEATQFRCAHGFEIAHHWKHVGHLNLDGEKMSKSLGNIFNAEEFIKQYNADTLRLLFISSSYSAPLDLKEELINATFEKVAKTKKVILQAKFHGYTDTTDAVKDFATSIQDFKFSEGMKIFNEKIKNANKGDEASHADIVAMARIIGLNIADITITEDAKSKYSEWEKARANKDFERADVLRGELNKLGLI